MSKGTDLPVYTFTVTWMGLDGLLREEGVITASYFQESGAFLQFKDTEHLVVEAFRTSQVERIVRTEKPVRV